MRLKSETDLWSHPPQPIAVHGDGNRIVGNIVPGSYLNIGNLSVAE